MDEFDYQRYSEWSFRLYVELIALAIIFLLPLFLISRKYDGRKSLTRLATLSFIVSLVWFIVASFESLSSVGNPGWNVAAEIKEQQHFKMVITPMTLWGWIQARVGNFDGAGCIAGPLSLLVLVATFFLFSVPVAYLLRLALFGGENPEAVK